MVVNIASRVAMRGKSAATSGSVYERRRWIAQNEAPAAKGEGSYDGKTTSDPTYSTARVTWQQKKRDDDDARGRGTTDDGRPEGQRKWRHHCPSHIFTIKVDQRHRTRRKFLWPHCR